MWRSWHENDPAGSLALSELISIKSTPEKTTKRKNDEFYDFYDDNDFRSLLWAELLRRGMLKGNARRNFSDNIRGMCDLCEETCVYVNHKTYRSTKGSFSLSW